MLAFDQLAVVPLDDGLGRIGQVLSKRGVPVVGDDPRLSQKISVDLGDCVVPFRPSHRERSAEHGSSRLFVAEDGAAHKENIRTGLTEIH